jgi:hypothetical protein
MTIKLNLHNVTNGSVSARVWYSMSDDNGETKVTIYAKDFESGDALCEIFGADFYTNNTDTMTDYFEKGRVMLLPGLPMYDEALAAAERASGTPRRGRRTSTKSMAVIVTDEIVNNTRRVGVSCGKTVALVVLTKFGVSVLISGKTPRRSLGKHYSSLKAAIDAYRSPEMKAILSLVDTAKPRFHVRATETPVDPGVQ